MSVLSDAWATIRNGLRTSPKEVPSVAFASQRGAGQFGRVGKPNVRLYRNWAEHSEWVRAAINVRKTQVSSSEWDIVPYDVNRPYSVRLQRRVKELFDLPNPRVDSFRTFIEPVVEDILVLDAGSIETVRNVLAQPSELWPVDGGSIRVNAFWDGEPNEPRYYWYPDDQERAKFLNKDLTYIMANPSSYRVVGLSPVETLKMTIDAELSGHEYNRRQVSNAPPEGVFNVGEGARPDQVEAFQNYFEMEIAGRASTAFIGGTKNPNFIQFRTNNRDMQFLEWQIYLVRKIAAVFQLSPQDLGVTFDVNRSTSEVQQEQTDDRGVRPLLRLVQEHLTREIVWDAAFGGPDNNLAFRFTRLNLRETLNQARVIDLQLAGVPYRSPNEIRREQGLEPWGPEFDEPMMVTPTGAVRLSDVPTAREVLESKSSARTQDNTPSADAAQSAPVAPGSTSSIRRH
jgi:phage portal protein BeeE